MSSILTIARTIFLIYTVSVLSGCFKPPYNNFRPDKNTPRTTAAGAGVGTTAGLVSNYMIPGVAVGTAIGAAVGLYKDSNAGIIAELQKNDIQFVEYGSTITLIVPTDGYFNVNSTELNDLQFKGLNAISKLIRKYPNSPVYVAGFTDDVGSRKHKKFLSQARAEAMVTFLWANGVKASLIQGEGYADNHPVSDNILIHGSAQNRRIEIQWFKNYAERSPEMIFASK